MIALGRPSRLKGAGFYDYDETGKRAGLWSGLAETFPVAEEQIPFQDMKDRLLFIEALETAKCFEEGVITSAAAANIGSIMGIGFPANTGGAAQFMTGYEADERGSPSARSARAFLARADELAAAYGERFRPTAYLRDLAARRASPSPPDAASPPPDGRKGKVGPLAGTPGRRRARRSRGSRARSSTSAPGCRVSTSAHTAGLDVQVGDPGVIGGAPLGVGERLPTARGGWTRAGRRGLGALLPQPQVDGGVTEADGALGTGCHLETGDVGERPHE